MNSITFPFTNNEGIVVKIGLNASIANISLTLCLNAIAVDQDVEGWVLQAVSQQRKIDWAEIYNEIVTAGSWFNFAKHFAK